MQIRLTFCLSLPGSPWPTTTDWAAHTAGVWLLIVWRLKSKIEVQPALAFSKVSHFDVEMDTSLVCPYLAVPGFVCICVLVPSSCKNTSHIGLGSTLMTSFYLNCLFKEPISKYSHSPRPWVLELQHTQSGTNNAPLYHKVLYDKMLST